MPGIDALLLLALLLGLRHAADPDHLAALSTLMAADPADGGRSAGRLGLAWGIGHAVTLALFGLPIVLFHSHMPEAAQRVAEGAVGLMIMFLAGRLLVQGRAVRAGRSRREAFTIGLVHGVGGSAGVGVLLLAGGPAQAEALGALMILALGSALSMSALSSAFGYAISRGPAVALMPVVAPVMAVMTLAFGGWYALGAAGAL